MIKLFLDVEPVAQGRPRIIYIGKKPSVKDPEKSKQFKELCADLARVYMNNGRMVKFGPKIPLEARFEFIIPRPIHMDKSRTLPVVRPDLDNYVKAIKDALNEVCYHDDSQIVNLIARKRYVEPGHAAGIEVDIIALQAEKESPPIV